ncbi:MAG: YihY/virulence factor BrkB family protein [Proteobacteria bacterium]|nr:YihY/virulence factor BrkB family protein [Pseudomonadota bacterium]
MVWDTDYSTSAYWIRVPIAVVRTLVYVYREFSGGVLNLRAMSLVYTTILSLVPLLAFSFSVLKGFSVQNQVEPLLLEYFAALGPEKSIEISTRIVEFVNNIDVRVLGAFGLGLLVYTIITLMQKS